LVSTGASTRMRVFLLTLAVADDIASIAILVAFYGHDLRPWSLLGAVGCLAVMVTLSASRGRSTVLLLGLGALAWWALVHAGVEASVVGVAIGVLLPPVGAKVRSRRRTELHRVRSLEHQLEPWVNVVVLPVFALANVGVTFAGSDLFSASAMKVFFAVLVARVVGKPLGIATTAWAVSRGGGRDRLHLGRRERVGVGAVAAVGFTVPLLIVHAALPAGPLVAAATCALLAGSVLGAASSAVVLRNPR
jgi:Na+:H+ antiporter, NhaA family